ncbi:MAG: catalase [Bacilli bacterium]|nr:catalase [Bacilli bacterium]
MIYLKKVVKHFHLVNKHRFYVFKFCLKAGIPFRGLVHDLSKYSYDEFWISAANFDGLRSPVTISQKRDGYSTVWLHHKGRNKHHFDYWEDCDGENRVGVFVPYKYIVESICDKLSAGMVYKGKKWSQHDPLDYWNKIDRNNIIVKHPGSVEFVDIVLKKIYDDGVDAALHPSYLKKIYDQVCKKYGIGVGSNGRS